MQVSSCSPTSHRGGTKLMTVLQKSIGVLMVKIATKFGGVFFDIMVFTYVLLAHLILGI